MEVAMIIAAVCFVLAIVVCIVSYVMQSIAWNRWKEAADKQGAVEITLAWQRCEKVTNQDFVRERGKGVTECSGGIDFTDYDNTKRGFGFHWLDKKMTTKEKQYLESVGRCFGFKGGRLPPPEIPRVPYKTKYKQRLKLEECWGPVDKNTVLDLVAIGLCFLSLVAALVAVLFTKGSQAA
jgi:hypothetical protein